MTAQDNHQNESDRGGAADQLALINAVEIEQMLDNPLAWDRLTEFHPATPAVVSLAFGAAGAAAIVFLETGLAITALAALACGVLVLARLISRRYRRYKWSTSDHLKTNPVRGSVYWVLSIAIYVALIFYWHEVTDLVGGVWSFLVLASIFAGWHLATFYWSRGLMYWLVGAADSPISQSQPNFENVQVCREREKMSSISGIVSAYNDEPRTSVRFAVVAMVLTIGALSAGFGFAMGQSLLAVVTL